MIRVLPRLLIALAFVSCTLPLFAMAQENYEQLLTTVRAAILSDPRASSMSPAEIDAMAAALARQAQSQGMTPQDIVWRPVPEDDAASDAAACEGFLCSLNHAFGFDGSDYTIPIWLGAISLMLIFLIAAILEHHHLHNKKLRAAEAAAQAE